MKVELQTDNTWLASQRMDNGRLLLAEGNNRMEARNACAEMVSHRVEYPQIGVVEEFLSPDTFTKIFGADT